MALLLLVAACRSPAGLPDTEVDFSALENSGLVLPVPPPDGYRLLGIDASISNDDPPNAALAIYAPPETQKAPVVVCTAATEDALSLCGSLERPWIRPTSVTAGVHVQVSQAGDGEYSAAEWQAANFIDPTDGAGDSED